MRIRLGVWALLAVLGCGGWSCRRGVEAPPEGEALYRRYCASCHGLAGRGGGRVADSLRVAPTDLTTLTEKEGGDSLSQVMRAIDGSRSIRAHGESAMPVWGEVFLEELQDSPYRRQTALLRVRAIAEYVLSLQEQ